jgi:hypothetical protein
LPPPDALAVVAFLVVSWADAAFLDVSCPVAGFFEVSCADGVVELTAGVVELAAAGVVALDLLAGVFAVGVFAVALGFAVDFAVPVGFDASDVDTAPVSAGAAAVGAVVAESCGTLLGAIAVVSIGADPAATAAESDCPARWPPPQAASTTRIPARLSPAIAHLRGTKPVADRHDT